MKKKTFLLISHSSELTGGAEENFKRILKYLHSKYNILGIFPEGVRAETFKKYSDQFITVPSKIFPVNRFSPIQYFMFFWKSLGKLYKIFDFINNKRIDVCLLNVSVSFMEIFPLLYYKIPYVIYIREQVIPSFIKNIFFKFINKTACGIVANSKYTRDDFIKATNCKNIELIYSTIDEEYINKSKLMNDKSEKSKAFFTILNIASLYNTKNQTVLVRAMNEIKDKVDIKVKIIGKKVDKDHYNNLIKLINNFNLHENVEIVGELNKEKLNFEMFNCDCIVITSKEEAQSLVLLEALYFEKPVISTNVGIVREVIKHNENGLIYNYDDPVTLAKHILTLKNSNNLYNKFMQESKRTYDKYFSTRISLKRLEEYVLKSINKTWKID